MKVAIIGCGLIGERRARALGPEHDLVAVADINEKRAQLVASLGGRETRVVPRWQEAIADKAVEVAFLSTTNDLLTPMALFALEQGKHVLMEKPGARSSRELEALVQASARSKKRVKVGFNHRYHPAFRKTREIIDKENVGEIMYIRGRYGHGGRVGYEKEWRAKKEISGGGELIDQGVHLIDLSRWFLGDFEIIQGCAPTYFWNMDVEDNGFLSLRTVRNQMAWLHVSCTEWKNMFSFEIYCKRAKLQIDGLGGSYGVERLSYYRMLPQMGPPETTIWEYPGADQSWELEWKDFVRAIREGGGLNGDLNDAFKALQIVDRIYEGDRG